jgi:hypothetical protein
MKIRPEQEIFDELSRLCVSPGYIHAVAFLSFRDNMILYSGEMKPEDSRHLFSKQRLIRTELSTLIGLMLKGDIDYSMPSIEVLQGYVQRTEALLSEIHESMKAEFFVGLTPENIKDKTFDPFNRGAVLREPIFYGGESAYSFQYRDLVVRKYASDEQWLKANKGFSIQSARDVVHAVGQIQNDKSVEMLKIARQKGDKVWPFLSGDTFTVQEVADRARVDIGIANNVLAAFSVPAAERNQQFRALNDFNIATALPLLRTSEGSFVLFHIYSFAEALYESPFYWMSADKAYIDTAMRHRGRFTEEFATERLALVFGMNRVHSNVGIVDSKGKTAGEIDVLVVFGDRAIVLQAKSKRLTLEARRGNDGQIKDDFKKSIQDGYDQGLKCARLLGTPGYLIRDGNSNRIELPTALKEIYILCVVADHYPALGFQARQFLKYETSETIPPPFILDVFTLDALTEMLESPLRLLSYIDRRVKYSEKVVSSHELTILSYHLKRNLWFGGEHDMVLLEDDISSDLDTAMTVRRDGVPGARTPEGVLTRLSSTTLGRLVAAIEAGPDPGMIAFGFMVLTLGEDTVIEISKGIDHLVQRAQRDGKGHDLTVCISGGSTGLTVHCNNDAVQTAGLSLRNHCYARKYTEKAQTWFGICVHPKDTMLRFGLSLDFKWEKDARMDEMTGTLSRPVRHASGSLKMQDVITASLAKKGKKGRNDPCLCGSGKRYKKCCLYKPGRK